MRRADLHLHSTASDGLFTPRQVLQRAIDQTLTDFALTDHDSFAGYEAVADEVRGIRLIQGVELSLCDRRGMHLLCYGQGRDTALHEKVRQLSAARIGRMRAMIRLVQKQGIPVEEEALMRIRNPGRPHLARAMVQTGKLPDVQTAFTRYLAEGACCYVPGDRLNLRQALDLCAASGFLPVLAHPAELQLDLLTLRPLLQAWKAQGLWGMEVYHPSGARLGYEALARLAGELRLGVTGGSDDHGDTDRHGNIGSMVQAWPEAEQDMLLLDQAMEQAGFRKE